MALIDDPIACILRLFEMEEREGRGANCIRFAEGTRPAGLPLEIGEMVYGIYKNKYHFTPNSLIIAEQGKIERIPWADVCNCSSKHGEGSTFSNVTLVDGRTFRVRVGEMATGWSGRVSQLYHQMIERYGQRAALGRPLMPMHEFFATVTDDYSIAPNLDPHPTLAAFHAALCELEESHQDAKVLMQLVPEVDELVADGIVIVTTSATEAFSRFAEAFRSEAVVVADDATLRKVGPIPDGYNVWYIAFD
jgi:hypothetical protein